MQRHGGTPHRNWPHHLESKLSGSSLSSILKPPPPDAANRYIEGMLAPQEEPNNRFPTELCVAANATEIFGNAWGWADAQCGQQLSYMCRMRRKQRSIPTAADRQ